MSSENGFERRVTLAQYGTQMVLLAKEAADNIRLRWRDETRGEKPRIGDTQWFSIYQELVHFFLYVTARSVTPEMDQDYTTDALNELKDLTIEGSVSMVCRDWPHNLVEKIKKECFDNFYVSVEYYETGTAAVEDKPGTNLENTLLGKAGKTIAELNEVRNPADVLVIQEIVVNCLLTLKPQEALARLIP